MSNNNAEISKPSSKTGSLLHSITDSYKKCCGSTHRVELEFYEHLMLVRITEKPSCGCLPTKYFSSAIPRFKIMDVTFTNGARSRLWLSYLLGTIGFVLTLIGAITIYNSAGAIAALIFGPLFVLSAIVPLFLFRHHRNVTFDIRKGGGNKSSFFFSNVTELSFELHNHEPDEGFLLDYIFGNLRQGTEGTHKVSHLNYASLANPFDVVLNGSLVEGSNDGQPDRALMKKETTAAPILPTGNYVFPHDP